MARKVNKFKQYQKKYTGATAKERNALRLADPDNYLYISDGGGYTYVGPTLETEVTPAKKTQTTKSTKQKNTKRLSQLQPVLQELDKSAELYYTDNEAWYNPMYNPFVTPEENLRNLEYYTHKWESTDANWNKAKEELEKIAQQNSYDPINTYPKSGNYFGQTLPRPNLNAPYGYAITGSMGYGSMPLYRPITFLEHEQGILHGTDLSNKITTDPSENFLNWAALGGAGALRAGIIPAVNTFFKDAGTLLGLETLLPYVSRATEVGSSFLGSTSARLAALLGLSTAASNAYAQQYNQEVNKSFPTIENTTDWTSYIKDILSEEDLKNLNLLQLKELAKLDKDYVFDTNLLAYIKINDSLGGLGLKDVPFETVPFALYAFGRKPYQDYKNMDPDLKVDVYDVDQFKSESDIRKEVIRLMELDLKNRGYEKEGNRYVKYEYDYDTGAWLEEDAKHIDLKEVNRRVKAGMQEINKYTSKGRRYDGIFNKQKSVGAENVPEHVLKQNAVTREIPKRLFKYRYISSIKGDPLYWLLGLDIAARTGIGIYDYFNSENDKIKAEAEQHIKNVAAWARSAVESLLTKNRKKVTNVPKPVIKNTNDSVSEQTEYVTDNQTDLVTDDSFYETTTDEEMMTNPEDLNSPQNYE